MPQFLINSIFRFFNWLLWSLTIATPLIILILVLYAYTNYNKWKFKEDKEAERIIIKRNEQINETVITIKKLEEEKEEHILENYNLAKEKKTLEKDIKKLNQELGVDIPAEDEDSTSQNVPEETVKEEPKTDYSKFTVDKLKDICKDLKLTNYSRLPKAQMVELIEKAVEMHDNVEDNNATTE